MINTWPCLKTYWFVFLRCPPPHSKKRPFHVVRWDSMFCERLESVSPPPNYPDTQWWKCDGHLIKLTGAHFLSYHHHHHRFVCLSPTFWVQQRKSILFFLWKGEREKVGTPLYCWCPHSSFSLFCCIYFFSSSFCTARQDYNVGGGERERERMEKGSIFWYHGVRQPLVLYGSLLVAETYLKTPFFPIESHNPVELSILK